MNRFYEKITQVYEKNYANKRDKLTIRVPFRTFFFASETVLALLARPIAFGPFPSTRTRALGIRLITRTVVLTVALGFAFLAVQAARTKRLALNT